MNERKVRKRVFKIKNKILFVTYTGFFFSYLFYCCLKFSGKKQAKMYREREMRNKNIRNATTANEIKFKKNFFKDSLLEKTKLKTKYLFIFSSK